jgi:hypothetical protein
MINGPDHARAPLAGLSTFAMDYELIAIARCLKVKVATLCGE